MITLDLRALAALRIGLGSLILLHLALLAPELETFFTDSGVLPRSVWLNLPYRRSYANLHLSVESVWGAALLHLLGTGAALALLLGYRTRLATFVCWLFLISLSNRNPWITDAGVAQLRLTLFWGMLLPLGARASVDALRNPHWAALPNAFRSWANTGYLLQIAVLYLFAALSKSDPVWTEHGTAFYYTFHLDTFATEAARWLLSFPAALKALTFVALATEYAIAALLLFPASRPLGVFLIWFFQVGVALCLNLGWMPLAAIVMTFGLLPSRVLDRLPRPLWRRAVHWGHKRLPQTAAAELPGAYRLSLVGRSLALSSCAYLVFLTAVAPRAARDYQLPMPVQAFAYVFQLFQNWAMFAPGPGDDDGWFVLEGVAYDRKTYDLLAGGRPVFMGKPDTLADRIPNQRWRCWFGNLRAYNHAEVNQRLVTWAVNRWNRRQPREKWLYYARLMYISERTPPPEKPVFMLQAQVVAEWKAPP